MTYTEFNTVIANQIEGLADRRRLQFSLDICKRLLPEYRSFHEKYRWGNPNTIVDGIDYCSRILMGDRANDRQVVGLIKSIEEVTPDTNDFGDWSGSYALNACVAVLESLEFLRDNDIEHVVNVSTCMTDTVDFKISETFGRLSDEAIDAHPWMLTERNQQIALTK